MGKGWGLSLESKVEPVPMAQVSANKPAPISFSLSPGLNQYKDSMLPWTDFPENFNSRDNQTAISRADENREVDFFADNNKSNNNNHNTDSKTGFAVKKKISSSLNDAPRLPDGLNTGLNLIIANSGSDQSTVDDGISADAEDKRANKELAQLQVDLKRMNAENQRLKEMVSQVSSDCSALHGHLLTLMQQQQNSRTENKQEPQEKGMMVPRQFLELVPSSKAEKDEPSQSSSGERTIYASPHQNNKEVSILNNGNPRDGEGTGREESPDSESWVPNKVPKLNAAEAVDQAAAVATMRKPRVSVRARSEAPMISDGCQWRKYGQKMAKGNPCPRAYYRCTMAVGCPVRKQVQRCAEDRAILITTYEGTHNHPLPPAAMAMASTTSAAANMLLSGSMSSADGLMNPNFLARAILPGSNSSMATISASAPFPTVTLDLTHSPNPLQFQRSSTPFQVPFSGHSHQNFAAIPTPPPMAQVLGPTLYNQSKFSGLQVSQEKESTTAQVPFRSPQLEQGQKVQTSFADTLSAATAAITADPNFTAALAAAITSIINGGHGHPNNTNATSTNATNVATTNSNFMGTQ